MNTPEKFRDADYDTDPFFDKTTSCPEGLPEMLQFYPNLPRSVRRTNSADDIQRFRDHFPIAQRNMGKWFKWKHYLKVLGDDLRHFDTLIIMTKAFLERLASPQESEMSHYVTASEAGFPDKSLPRCKIEKRETFVVNENIRDSDSASSMAVVSINSVSSVTGNSNSSNLSLSPQKNLLKKFCSEIRQLAAKTYRTVEKMSLKSKYCSACGDYIGNAKVHKECSQLLNLIDKKKPITPKILNKNSDISDLSSEIRQLASNTSKMVQKILVEWDYSSASGDYKDMLKKTNISRKFSMTSLASIGSGESTISLQSMQKFYTSPKEKEFPRRMFPFMKKLS